MKLDKNNGCEASNFNSGARTIYGHLNRDRAALALGVRRLAEVNGGVISVNWREH